MARMPHTRHMRYRGLSKTERIVSRAFREGERAVVGELADRQVRASVLRSLLLSGESAKHGARSALRINGADVVGKLEIVHGNVPSPISLHDCTFNEPIDIYGSRFRQLSLPGCTIRGIDAANVVIDSNIRLSRCRSEGTVRLVGARLEGALILDGAQFSDPVLAIDGTRLKVGSDIRAQHGFSCNGEFKLEGGDVAGSLFLEGAVLKNSPGVALRAAGLHVGGVINLCSGLVAEGSIILSNAEAAGLVCFKNAELRGAVECRHLVARELILLPTIAPAQLVDLRYSSVGLIRDDPSSWPEALRLDGMTYRRFSSTGKHSERVGLLSRDPNGFRPQPYGQLAAVLREEGHDDEARTVMLAYERHRRDGLRPMGAFWGYLQDWTIGYGYRPWRALLWLLVFLSFGTGLFAHFRPRAAEPNKAPEFNSLVYSADVMLPGIDFGQQSAFLPQGATVWYAYTLVLVGLLLVSTIAAATARRLRRS